MTDLLTTRQVQDILKVDRITIYRMLQDGRLKGVKSAPSGASHNRRWNASWKAELPSGILAPIQILYFQRIVCKPFRTCFQASVRCALWFWMPVVNL